MTRDEVVIDLRAGKTDKAMYNLKIMLKMDEHNDDLWGLLGLAELLNSNIRESEHAQKQALRFAGSKNRRYKHLGNLAVLYIENGREKEARELLDQNWQWSSDEAEDASLIPPAINFANLLIKFSLYESAILFLYSILKSGIKNWTIISILALALCEVERSVEGWRLIETEAASHSEESDYYAVSAFVAAKATMDKEASYFSAQQIKRHPVFLSKLRVPERPGVVIINQPPPPSIMDRPLVGQHHHGNFPSQIADLMSEQFVFDSIFCTGTTHGIERLPKDRPRIVLNNFTNAETLSQDGQAQNLANFETALGLTTINSVTGAQNCSRLLNARRLTGIANLIVPKIELFMKSWAGLDYLTRAIRREFSFPVIIRSIHQQHSHSAFFVASESELASAIENINEDAFYCIQFVETLHFNRFRHRLRAAVVDGEVFIIAADFAHSWDARGARRSIESSAYTQRPDLLQLANDQILHPENHFGSSVFTTLRQIAERIPLDIFGIDFDVNSDGNLIFFEANATMKLLSWANVYPTPAEIDARVRESITKAFLKRY